MDLVQGRALDEVVADARARADETRAVSTRGAPGILLGQLLGAPADTDDGSPAAETDWYRAAARVVDEAARTVEAAHAAGLVHRDIKPKNVMLRRDGRPVLLDFGLAGACDPSGGDVTQGLFGTMSYLAPEQVRSGHVGNDPRSDVYQLGCVLYEMLTLMRAFDGGSSTELLRRIERGECRRPRDLDPAVPFELQAICLRAMETEPDRRYATAKALHEDLDRWLGGTELPIAARGGRLALSWRSGRYALRRNRAAAAACAALVVGALLGAVALVNDAPAAPHIVAFRYRPAGAGEALSAGIELGETTFGSAILSVSAGDRLGIQIDAPEPLYVYVLSVFGDADPPSAMLPMLTRVVPDLPDNDVAASATAEDPPDTQWGRMVPAGRTSLKCTDIGSYDPTVPYEGLWVYTSREPRPDLEDWMWSLNERANVTGASGVRLAEARRLFESRGLTVRGGSPAPLSAAEARALRDSLTAAILLGESAWPYDDPRRWTVSWPVDP
jgi:hypothetical protein